MREGAAHYDVVSRAFHWITAVAVMCAFLLGPDDFGRSVQTGNDPSMRLDVVLHESLGLFIFMQTVLRLLWIAIRPSPPQHGLNPLARLLSTTVHTTLWILLLAIPVTALMTLISENVPLTLVGASQVKDWNWIPLSLSGTGVDWGEVHKFLANAFIWIAGLHALAALYHHFRLKDGILRTMLP